VVVLALGLPLSTAATSLGEALGVFVCLVLAPGGDLAKAVKRGSSVSREYSRWAYWRRDMPQYHLAMVFTTLAWLLGKDTTREPRRAALREIDVPLQEHLQRAAPLNSSHSKPLKTLDGSTIRLNTLL
jgi:hypothetical protein